MRVLIYPDVDIWNYILSSLAARDDICLLPLNRYCHFFQRVVRKASCMSSVPSWMVLSQGVCNTLSRLKAGDIVVLCEYTYPTLISALSKVIHEGVSLHLWLWNRQIYTTAIMQRMTYISSHGFQVSTYDQHNADLFQFRCFSQFFPIRQISKVFSSNRPIIYDFFFVGYQKNRSFEIEVISKALSSYHCHFVTVHNLQEYLPYPHYLQLASQCRCLVEIVHTGDTACTLRPLEALALRRKLLTNNSYIHNYSFYHPDNIFIFGKDDLNRLPEFLSSPFVPLSEQIISTYDINTWIDSFV